MNLLKIRKEVEKIMGNEPAHDLSHIMRVFKNAQLICQNEKGVNKDVVLAAALLHDIVLFPKTSKSSRYSADYSARKAKKILQKYDIDDADILKIINAIRDHSYSKGKTPDTLEGKILQDADRLDAVGAIGIARAFSVGRHENRPLYNSVDPFCIKREPSDDKWTLDHFYSKLLLLESCMHTKTAKIEVRRRTRFLQKFLDELQKELQP